MTTAEVIVPEKKKKKKKVKHVVIGPVLLYTGKSKVEAATTKKFFYAQKE